MRAPSGISSPLQPGRIAAAVPPLVVAQDERRHRIRERDAGDDVGADLRVNADLLELFGRQRTRLGEDVLRHGELADVVQQRGRPDRLDFVVGHAERACHARRVHLDTSDVVGRASGPSRRSPAPALRSSPGAAPPSAARGGAPLRAAPTSAVPRTREIHDGRTSSRLAISQSGSWDIPSDLPGDDRQPDDRDAGLHCAPVTAADAAHDGSQCRTACSTRASRRTAARQASPPAARALPGQGRPGSDGRLRLGLDGSGSGSGSGSDDGSRLRLGRLRLRFGSARAPVPARAPAMAPVPAPARPGSRPRAPTRAASARPRRRCWPPCRCWCSRRRRRSCSTRCCRRGCSRRCCRRRRCSRRCCRRLVLQTMFSPVLQTMLSSSLVLQTMLSSSRCSRRCCRRVGGAPDAAVLRRRAPERAPAVGAAAVRCPTRRFRR